MKWSNVQLIFFRETRDQLRDRRMIFMIAVLPLVLYPLLGLNWLQFSQFMEERPSEILVAGSEGLPTNPQLLNDEEKLFNVSVCSPDESKRMKLTIEPGSQDQETATKWVRSGRYDAIVSFPQDFDQRLTEFQTRLGEATRDGVELGAEDIPRPEIYYDAANQHSAQAHFRVREVLRIWRDQVVRDTLRISKIPERVTSPFEVAMSDVAEESSLRAAQWSVLLPFVVVIWALTGAFYPAIDLCAGEKERGTLETLLSSPAARSEIVWGKLLTVMTFSMITSLLNLMSMGMTGFMVMSQLPGGPEAPPVMAITWLVIGLFPIAAFFSALALAIAAFARSSKEGQYYLMPLLLVTLPLMLLPMRVDLDLGTALIPVTGLMLLLRKLIEGEYLTALTFLPPVAVVTGLCCMAAIRWAVDQFHKESVMFRESERIDLSLWFKHVIRERRDTPSIPEALLCATLLLIIRFFGSFSATSPDSWNAFATMMIVGQVAMIATPALLMTIILTRSPLKTLHLKPLPKQWLTVPAGALLALLLHPASVWLSVGIRTLYPISAQAMEQLEPISQQILAAPLFKALLVMAFLPAVCEELAFRGFIMSGLRRTGKKWTAIGVTALLFGITHGILQQSISAAIVGMVLGYITIQSGSLIPAMLFHLVHNSLGVIFARVSTAYEAAGSSMDTLGQYSWLFQFDGGLSYRWAVVLPALTAATCILFWFRSLPYDRTPEEEAVERIRKDRRNQNDAVVMAALKVDA